MSLTQSDVISFIAITISVSSFAINIFNVFRDRPRLKTKSTLVFHNEKEEPAYISVEAVNIGRRPLVITELLITYEGGAKGSFYIENAKHGFRINENEIVSKDVSMEMLFSHIHGAEGESAVDLEFQDASGKRYPIRDAKQNIENFFKK